MQKKGGDGALPNYELTLSGKDGGESLVSFNASIFRGIDGARTGQAIAAGFQIYIAKPVEPIELNTMVAGARSLWIKIRPASEQ